MRMLEYRVDFGHALASKGRFSISSRSTGDTCHYSYEIDDTLLDPFVATMPAAVIDAVDILRMLGLIDRVTRRTLPGDPRPIEQRGPRRLVVSFPVRDLGFWRTSSAAQSIVSDLVWSLGHDRLESSFVPIGTRSRAIEGQPNACASCRSLPPAPSGRSDSGRIVSSSRKMVLAPSTSQVVFALERLN